MKKKNISRLCCAAALLTSFVAVAPSAYAQDAVAQFYKGKTVNIVVGSTPGGGFDTYARVLSRYLGRYLPGTPNVVVNNMPGAGSHAASSFIYSAAPKDGTAIGAIFPNAILEALLGDRVQLRHDPARFNYLGSAASDVYICVARADAPVQKFADLFDKELVVGATAGGGSTRDYPVMLNSLLDTKFRVVSGYPGTREIVLALEKGEVSGACGTAWSSLTQQRPDWFTSGAMRVIAQESTIGLPELTAKGVPLTRSFAKTDEQRQILDLVYSQTIFGRPYVLAPEVPTERVEALRKAFMASWADPELLAEAARMKLDISPKPGAEIQALVAKIFATSPAVIEKTRAAIAGK